MGGRDWGLIAGIVLHVLTAAAAVVAGLVALGLIPLNWMSSAPLACCVLARLVLDTLDPPRARYLRWLARRMGGVDTLGGVERYAFSTSRPDTLAGLLPPFVRRGPERTDDAVVYREGAGVVIRRRMVDDDAIRRPGETVVILGCGGAAGRSDRGELSIPCPRPGDREALLRAVACQLTLDAIRDMVYDWASHPDGLSSLSADLVEATVLDADRLLGSRLRGPFAAAARRRAMLDAIRAVRLRAEPDSGIRRAVAAFGLDACTVLALVSSYWAVSPGDLRILPLALFVLFLLADRDGLFDGVRAFLGRLSDRRRLRP